MIGASNPWVGWIKIFGILLWVEVFLPQMVGAETLHPAYEPPKDLAHQWAKGGTIALAAISAGLVLYTLVYRRHRLGEAGTRWMLFLGVCVLPMPVLVVGGAVGIEQSKSVDFCASCHVMEPFVSDMRNPESDLLAAVHYKQRYIQRDHCYRCHSDYGFLGDIEAKKDGVMHVWKNVTGTYQMPIRINKPYRYTICLDCHGQALSFRKVALHEGVVDEVLRGETSCLDCHVASHPGREEEETTAP